MARVEISEAVLTGSPSLRAVSGASVQVNVRDGSAATVYAAETGGSTVTNPISSDAFGRIEGWLETGSYDLVVSGSGFATYTQRFEAASGALVLSLESRHVFVAAPTGVGATDTAAITAARAELPAGGGTLHFRAGDYVDTIARTLGAGEQWRGEGRYATTILHGFNGDYMTMGEGAALEHLTIDGQGATFTGKGLLFTGTNGRQELTSVRVVDFDGACLDFAVGAGSQSRFTGLMAHRTSATTGTDRYAIVISATQQLSAVPRKFFGLETQGNCAIDFGGCNDTLVVGSVMGDLKFSLDSRGVNIVGSRIMNQVALTVLGQGVAIVGCDVLPALTIGAGSNTVVIDSQLNTPIIIDSSGTATNLLSHYPVAYVPVLTSGGTAPSLGNGTLTGRYSRSGAQITATISFTVGSTTTLGTGELRFSLPTARVGTSVEFGSAQFQIGATNYTAAAQIPGNVGYARLIRDTSGAVAAASPAAFGTGDLIRLTITYNV